MSIRWTGPSLVTLGRTRETGEVYDDFTVEQVAELTARGLIAAIVIPVVEIEDGAEKAVTRTRVGSN